MTAFQVGDFVRFLNDEGEGHIVSFQGDMALVEDASGFAFEHPLGELVPVVRQDDEMKRYMHTHLDMEEHLSRNTHQQGIKKINRDFKMLYKNELATSDRRRGELLEVDLHAHELNHVRDGMSAGEIIAIQLEHFERMMHMAEKNKIRRVVFIHGIGQGVLRAEIRKRLNQYYPHAVCQDAAWHTYGQGATLVELGNR